MGVYDNPTSWSEGAGGNPATPDQLTQLAQAVAAINPSYTAPTFSDPVGATAIRAADLNGLAQGLKGASDLIGAGLTAVQGTVVDNGDGGAVIDTDGLSGSIATPEMFIASATTDTDGNVTDWAPAINAAFAAGYADLELSARYYFIRTPIRIPSNRGPRIFSRSGKKGSVLTVYMTAPTRAVLEYVGVNDGTGYNYAGITVENVSFLGNDSVCHAVWLQDVSYPNFARVNIAGFKGAGLLLDNCEDGAFDIEVQDCGRTTGSYSSITDRGDNSKTTYAGIHLISTTSGAHNNMLRFTGEIEQMKTSPYVWVNDPGAIGLWFNDIHAEVRETPEQGSFDFLKSDGADCEFKGVYAAATFRKGFLLSGYGQYRFFGGRYLGDIVQTDSGSTGLLSIVGAHVGDIQTTAWAGPHTVSGCQIDGNVTIDYPGGGPTRISDSKIAGTVTVTNTGSGDSAVIVDNCTVAGYSSAASNTGSIIRNSRVTGDCSSLAVLGRIDNVRVNGSTTYNTSDGSFNPQRKYGQLPSVPVAGTWSRGDIVYSSTPAPGGYLGWVCTTAGTPGTWKGFAPIQA